MSAAIEIVTDLGRLHEIADQWRVLASARSSAFVTPEWFFAWMGVYGNAATPVVAVRRSAGRVAGLMPLVASTRGRARVLRFAGAELGDLFSPLDSESEADLAVAALRTLRAGGDEGALLLDHVEVGSDWVQALKREGEPVTELEHQTEALPQIDIAGTSWEDYLAGKSANFRQQLGKKRRRLERDHEVLFRRSDRASLDADLGSWVSLHHGRWASRGGSAALDSESARFHSALATSLEERGWLRLWIVEIDGRPAAAWYGWQIGDRYSYYLGGFDETYAEYSLGTLLLAHTLQDAMASGCTVYDLLLGSEPYKKRFSTSERQAESLIISSRFHPLRISAITTAAARRAADRLGPSAAARVKRPLRALADRVGGSKTL